MCANNEFVLYVKCDSGKLHWTVTAFICLVIDVFAVLFCLVMFCSVLSPVFVYFYPTVTTVLPAKNDSDMFCLQLLSKTLTCTLHLS